MTTWYAAMLFAVVPLRTALPGSPAFGSWIDLTIVLWVLVAFGGFDVGLHRGLVAPSQT
jgi:Domain of unknown function (DUF4436)